MQSLNEFPVLPQAGNDHLSWMALLKSNSAALFQTALLLSADRQIAEASIAITIDDLDLSKAPRQDESSNLQETVAMHALRMTEKASVSRNVEARPVLQRGLWPILRLEKFARACFVLRVLLGYPTSRCAEMIGLKEAAVEDSLVTAIIQLHQAFVERGSFEACSQHPLRTDVNSIAHDKRLV